MKKNYELVFCHFLSIVKKLGISEGQLNSYSKLTNKFLADYNAGLISNYDDFINSFLESRKSSTNLWRNISRIKAIRDFDLHGKMPRVLIKSKYEKLSIGYKQIVDEVVSYARLLGRAERSLQNLKFEGASFFYYLDSIGLSNINDITIENVDSYFFCDGEIKHGYNAKKDLHWFFKLGFESSGDSIFQKISSMLPSIVHIRKVYPSLKDCEADRIEKTLLDNTNRLSWRDRAIGALSYYTGMRSCDISRLQYKNIMWKEQKICFTQCKTKIDCSLRLDAVIGNPIYEYIVNERPRVKSSFIFIRTKSNDPIDRHDVYTAIVNLFFEAGVRQVDGRRGAHLLRHHLATKMVQNDTDISIVSSALGQVNPNSINSYLETDTTHLKQYGINVDNFFPQLSPAICDKDVILKMLGLISLNPNDFLNPLDNHELKKIGIEVTKAPLYLIDDHYYVTLKSLGIDNHIINLKSWKN